MQTEVQNNITYIPISEIFPHPDNPRKNLGDLSELADSIKKNGIMQNLTVIKGHYQTREEWQALADEYNRNPSEETRIKMNTRHYDNGYTVIIGHRRLSAASLAELKTVPCIISEMDYKTQISIMLLENMQRTDLTVYEQAKAFGQLRFNLDVSVDEISKKTGFSQSTVRHRLELLKLDEKEFKESEDRGGTINDYLELEKIKDVKLRNEALKLLGTSNFKWAVTNALSKEKQEKIKSEWISEMCEIAAEQIDISKRLKHNALFSGNYLNAINEADKARIREAAERAASENQNLYWCIDKYCYIYLLGNEKSDNASEETGRREAERTQRVNTICELEDRANELRTDFVKSYTGNKDDLPFLLAELLISIDYWCDIDYCAVSELLDINIRDDSDDSSIELYNDSNYRSVIKKYPQKVILAYLFELKNSESLHNYYGEYIKQTKLTDLYEILTKIGYKASDEELELINGTHLIFLNKGNGE